MLGTFIDLGCTLGAPSAVGRRRIFTNDGVEIGIVVERSPSESIMRVGRTVALFTADATNVSLRGGRTGVTATCIGAHADLVDIHTGSRFELSRISVVRFELAGPDSSGLLLRPMSKGPTRVRLHRPSPLSIVITALLIASSSVPLLNTRTPRHKA